MNNGKRYIFYDVLSGDILVHEARNRLSIMPSVERAIEIYPKLRERSNDSYDVLILNYDDYAQDFAESNGYRVNSETKELEFSYPDPNEPEAEPVYQKPLSEEVNELKARQDATQQALDFLIMGGM